MSPRPAPGPSDRELLPKISAIQNDPLSFLVDLSRQYGSVAAFRVFRLPVIVLSSAEGVRHVLQDNHAHYSKNTIQYNALTNVTGRGLLTNDGSSWLRQRRLAQPAFARPRMQALDEIVVPAAADMLTRWSARPQNPLDIDREMMQLTLEVVGKALFSIDLRGDAHALTGAVLTTLDHIVYRARNMVTPPAFLPTPRNLRFRRALAELERAVYQMIADRKAAADPGGDLLGMFLAARDEHSQAMSDLQVRDELMTMLVAGHETVASALTWAWMLLAQNPSAREQMYAEVAQVLGGRPPTSADLPTLPYTAAVFAEALRLYPPAWVISRQALAEDEVEGFRIPKGALVIISPYAIQRSAENWDDPEAFRPERFLGGETGANRHTYIPFGAGPRLCIGNHFAQVEAQLILACVAQRARLELTSPPPRLDALVTLRPRGGLPMRADILIKP